MKENKPEKDFMQEKKKDYVTNKLLVVFTLAFAVLLFIMNISNAMHSIHMATGLNVTRVVAIVAALLTVFGVVLMFVERAKKKDVSCKLLCGKNIALASLFITVCTAVLSFAFLPQTVTLLYIFIPSVVVLYIIYYSYPREFFFIALASAIGGMGIWLVGSEFINRDMIVTAAVVAAVAILAVLTVVAQIGKGKIGKREIFKSDARYAIVYLSYLLVLMLLVASLLAVDLTFYFVLGIVAYIVITGIYYTIKLI